MKSARGIAIENCDALKTVSTRAVHEAFFTSAHTTFISYSERNNITGTHPAFLTLIDSLSQIEVHGETRGLLGFCLKFKCKVELSDAILALG